MDQQAARTAEQLTSTVAQRSGTAVRWAGDALGRAGEAVEQHGSAAAPAIGAAVGGGVGRAVELGGGAAQVARRATTAAFETAQAVAAEPATRGGAALTALRGQRVGPPVAVRRWPWALLAAGLGAGAAVAVVLVRRRVEGQDAPGAQEPHELRAVVDVPARSGLGTAATDGPAPASAPTR